MTPVRIPRIAVVVPSLRGGGLERLARDLVLGLGPRGFEFAVFCLNGLGVYADELTAAGVEVRESKDHRFRVRGVPRQLVADLRRFRPHVIHAHSGTWLPSSVAKTLLRAPRLVFTEHGRYPPEPHLRAVIERWCFNRTDRFVAVSPAVAQYVQKFLRLRETPEVIENGVAPSPVGPGRESKRRALRREWGVPIDAVAATAVGRFAAVKNHFGLVRAFATISAQSPRTHLILIGQGPLEPELRALTTKLGIAPRVHFLGFRRDVGDCLSASDYFVLSSDTEGLPVSLLEAMAAGLPIVSTRVGGIAAALGEPPAGILVPPGDEESLSRALLQMSADEAERARLAELSVERAKRYSFDAFADRHEALYRSLLD